MAQTKREQIGQFFAQCKDLPADIRFSESKEYFTVQIPPPWCETTRPAAEKVQNRIKEWSTQYPNIVCCCVDSYSALVYVL